MNDNEQKPVKNNKLWTKEDTLRMSYYALGVAVGIAGMLYVDKRAWDKAEKDPYYDDALWILRDRKGGWHKIYDPDAEK